ncbi:MarR family winged helix-turn-helix transcriptional regulator [Nocardia sp. IBHARD005]|uniref:MarR family winged helix-turn-helix transcriptional regulator n=1 Tax=Nocardia sp. IBHARD005 TaxID=3457765 RepID=UPI004058873F
MLLALWEHPGLSMKELGARLQLDYGTASPVVARMQGAGLLESARSVTDGRVVHLRPTEAGLRLPRPGHDPHGHGGGWCVGRGNAGAARAHQRSAHGSRPITLPGAPEQAELDAST